MTIDNIRDIEKKLSRGEYLGDFTAEEIMEAFYLGGGFRK